MKKTRLLAMIAVLALGLAACGKDKPAENENTESTTEAVAAPEPELSPEEKYPATVSPYDIHPGSLNSDEDTSDRWYPDGDTNAEYSFTLTQTSRQDDCVGLAFCLYKMIDGKDDDMCDVRLRDGGNGHAVTGEFNMMKYKDDKEDFDLTFQDNFSCYDFKSGKEWKRIHPDYGFKDQEWYDNAFSGLVAYRDLAGGKYQQIVMNEDHTFVESVTGMDDMTGHWVVKGTNVMDLVYDNPEDSGVQVVDAGSLLEDGGESGSETTYSDSWQQEFNISADGKVTEFGLFPKYDDDMNLIGYAPAFELTTKDELEALAKEKEEAIAAALAAGSPYPNPTADNIMDYTLDGVNLDQAPDHVIEYVEWDDKEADNYCQTVSKNLRSEEWVGYVIEVHGHFEGNTMYATTADKEHQIMIMTWHVGEGSKPEENRDLILKGVLWAKGTNKYIFFDDAHVTYVD